MSEMILDCPHCLAKRATFISTCSYKIKRQDDLFNLFLVCRICENGIVVVLRDTGSRHNEPQHVEGDPRLHNYDLKERFPNPETIEAPEFTPANIASFFVQGRNGLRLGHFDAAGAMFRKSLDVATLQLNPDLKGKNLYPRIEALAKSYAITPDMKEWAHEIRDIGNDAVHEEEPFTQEEAEDLRLFTELFLTYAFKLPGMLKARRDEHDDTDDE